MSSHSRIPYLPILIFFILGFSLIPECISSPDPVSEEQDALLTCPPPSVDKKTPGHPH